MAPPRELPSDELRCKCDSSLFAFKSTEEIDPLDDVIGQTRAVQAIDFGLNMHSPGYNIFVTGIDGTGKTTIVGDIARRFAKDRKTPSDWCMVNNFADPYRPKAIELPPGKAHNFKRRVQRLIDDLKGILPSTFENHTFEEKQAEIQKRFGGQEQALWQALEALAAEKKMAVKKTSAGYQAVALKDDQPISREVYEQLPKEEQERIAQDSRLILGKVEEALKEVAKIRAAMAKAMEKIMEDAALFAVRDRLAILKEEYGECRDILAYLDELQADIIENVSLFLPTQNAGDPVREMLVPTAKPSFQRYKVNILVDRRMVNGAPVIFEPNPTYQNVFGWIEKRAHMGTVSADFTMVQAGSLLQANGGYLIMDVASLLMNPMVWEALKRALQNKQLFIEDVSAGLGYATASLRPKPIALDVKVILIGEYGPFHLLQTHDAKFNEIFKVRADFDDEVRRTDETMHQYARFIARVCRENKLLHFTPDGVAAIVEFGETLISHKEKLSLRFGPVVGTIKEAEYWARKEDAKLVAAAHVAKAHNEYRFRYNLYEEKIHDSYVDKTILIDVKGKEVGQVNALAVYQMGNISFGRPSRITAETFMGKNGVINIEREAELSGKTHDKGVLILSGYLGRTFAQKNPLSLAISVTFEQSYGGIDGDSASSTELYAILSSLSGLPIDQGIAVTGSVNQKGLVQAIGGVNQKIEGFFDVCSTRGLTGTQGVMIPVANVQNLMLKDEVIAAVKTGQFHIYPVTTIEEGIEILTGKPAGKPDAEGAYPEGTVFGLVRKALDGYLERAVQLGKEGGRFF
jgi:lon-related putative ATP-dependent protease